MRYDWIMTKRLILWLLLLNLFAAVNLPGGRPRDALGSYRKGRFAPS
jgi:hypothetical protein